MCAFPIGCPGIIRDVQISTDLLVEYVASINVTALVYDFQVFLAPSAPNAGVAHLSSPYVTTPLVASVSFGGPSNILTAGNFYTATNINIAGTLVVTSGDRIGVRVRTRVASDPSAADITQLSFSATLSYIRS